MWKEHNLDIQKISELYCNFICDTLAILIRDTLRNSPDWWFQFYSCCRLIDSANALIIPAHSAVDNSSCCAAKASIGTNDSIGTSLELGGLNPPVEVGQRSLIERSFLRMPIRLAKLYKMSAAKVTPVSHVPKSFHLGLDLGILNRYFVQILLKVGPPLDVNCAKPKFHKIPQNP